MLDAMHSAACAISTCWGAISLLYRREQNPDAPTRLIRFKYSQEPMVSVPLLLFKHPWFSPGEHNHENHLSAAIHKNNCKPFPLPPSRQETIKSQKPRRTQQIDSLTSCVFYKITTLIYRATVGRLLKLPTGATEQ